ncbi:MAG: hypothetical protein Pars2KO_05700 [Parasphingorhabdus sp.]
MINGLHHVGLGVAHLDNAIDFYERVAGFPVVSRYMLDADNPLREGLNAGSTDIEIALIAGPNGYIECAAMVPATGHAAEPGPQINQSGIRHFCIQNRDCDMLAEGVKSANGSLFADPLDLGTGNQYAYARDREGNIIEIEGLPYAPADQPTWMGHVAIVTPDLDRMIAFYSDIIGSGLQGRAMVGPGPQSDKMGGLKNARLEGAWLPAANMLIEFWQFHAPESPPIETQTTMLDLGYTHICLETDDLDYDIAQMINAGAAIISDPVETYNVRIQFARDPDGNIVELLEPQDGFSHLISALNDKDIRNRTDALK